MHILEVTRDEKSSIVPLLVKAVNDLVSPVKEAKNIFFKIISLHSNPFFEEKIWREPANPNITVSQYAGGELNLARSLRKAGIDPVDTLFELVFDSRQSERSSELETTLKNLLIPARGLLVSVDSHASKDLPVRSPIKKTKQVSDENSPPKVKDRKKSEEESKGSDFSGENLYMRRRGSEGPLDFMLSNNSLSRSGSEDSVTLV